MLDASAASAGHPTGLDLGPLESEPRGPRRGSTGSNTSRAVRAGAILCLWAQDSWSTSRLYGSACKLGAFASLSSVQVDESGDASGLPLSGFVQKLRKMPIHPSVTWAETGMQKGSPSRVSSGENSLTRLSVLCHAMHEGCALSLMAIWIGTGRRHQIGVHAAHVGHSTVSDGDVDAQ